VWKAYYEVCAAKYHNFNLQLLLQLLVAVGRAFFYSEDVLVWYGFIYINTNCDLPFCFKEFPSELNVVCGTAVGLLMDSDARC